MIGRYNNQRLIQINKLQCSFDRLVHLTQLFQAHLAPISVHGVVDAAA